MFSWVEEAVRRVCSGLAVGGAVKLLGGRRGWVSGRVSSSCLGAYADAASFFATYLAWPTFSEAVSF